MKKVNIVVGRFQPFTAGHYACITAAKKLRNLPTVICMINTSEEKVDKKHPFPTSMLLDLYSEAFSGDPNIADIITVRSADIVLIGEELRKRNYEIASWTCGTDRLETYNRMSTKYHEQAGLSDDFELIEVARTDEDISATKVRNCLLEDDRSGFFLMMPKSVKRDDYLFDTLKEQIDKVYSLPEPEPKKTRRKKQAESYYIKCIKNNKLRKLEQRIRQLEKKLLSSNF